MKTHLDTLDSRRLTVSEHAAHAHKNVQVRIFLGWRMERDEKIFLIAPHAVPHWMPAKSARKSKGRCGGRATRRAARPFKNESCFARVPPVPPPPPHVGGGRRRWRGRGAVGGEAGPPSCNSVHSRECADRVNAMAGDIGWAATEGGVPREGTRLEALLVS